ncbi:hypothetical protein Tco_0198150, partial [Tanacetum coccineum]
EATLLSIAQHKTAIDAEAQENVAKIQEKLAEEEIKKMVEGVEDDESYASEFADSMINDDVDDSGTRIEPESYKENPKVVGVVFISSWWLMKFRRRNAVSSLMDTAYWLSEQQILDFFV